METFNPTIFLFQNSTELTRVSIQTSTFPQPTLSELFVLQLVETLEDSLPSSSSSPPSPLQKLRDVSSESLLPPDRKDESFRFTDLSFIRTSQQIRPTSQPYDSLHLSAVSVDTQFPNLVFADGHFIDFMSNWSGFPDGVYVGSLSELTSESVMKRVSEFVTRWNGGDLFWSINGLGAPDLTVVYVPEGCRVESPIHLMYVSMESGENESGLLPLSNPRVLLLVEKGGEVDVIEEFSGVDRNGSYWGN